MNQTPTTAETVRQIRAFNRAYTRDVGLLAPNYFDSGLSLSETRLLYDIGESEGITARALASALNLDEGYVSRILARFQKNGLISRTPDAKDARRRELRLTSRGRAEVDRMRRGWTETLSKRIAPLDASGRRRLYDALDDVRRLLSSDDVAPASHVRLRDLGPGDIGWITQRHGEYYQSNDGFDETFEPLVARILVDFATDHDPKRERGWIAEGPDSTRLGCIFCVRLNDHTAKLRLFFLEPSARGRGLGKHLLATCLRFAKEAGYQRMTLWTHESHREACALYARAGFALSDSHPVRSFGCDLVEQTWKIDLREIDIDALDPPAEGR